MRYGYWLPNVGMMDALDAPAIKRLKAAWPTLPDDPAISLMAQPHPQGGALIVWPREGGAALDLEAFGPGRPTHDGMTYYPSLAAPTFEDLIRPEQNRPPGTWITLCSGESFHVALATATPRSLIIRASGGIDVGGYCGEYGQLAFDLYEPFTQGGIPYTDPRLGRFLYLIQRQSYFVTEEMTEDLAWFADQDIKNILLAAFGVDPKALAAELAGSASVGPATPTSL